MPVTSTAYGSYYLKWEMQMLNFGLLSGWNCSIHCEVKLTSRASGGLSTGTEEVLVLEEDYVGLWSRKA